MACFRFGCLSVVVVVSFFTAIAIASSAFALDVPKAPALEIPIVDQTNTLTQAQITSLAQQIAGSRSEKSYQIGVLIISTLGNSEELDGYSIKVAREWGIGEEGKDNGVLMLIVKDDRKIKLEIGRGLEGDITDLQASRIIRNVITPEFKNDNYYQGISSGVTSIQLAVQNKPDPAAERDADAPSLIDMIMFGLVGVPMFLIWLAAVLGRSKSWWVGGVIGGVSGTILMLAAGFVAWSVMLLAALVLFGLLFDFLVSRNFRQHVEDGSAPSWWAGGTHIGGGGFGGGGGSFGGGGFGGGGASGSW